MTEIEMARRDIIRQQRRAYVRDVLKFRPRPEKKFDLMKDIKFVGKDK